MLTGHTTHNGSTMPELSADSTVAPAPVVAPDNRPASGPTLTLRPRLVFRLAGPLLIVLGVAGVAAGYLAATAIAVIGVFGLVAWLQRVSIDEHQVVIRGVRSSTTLPIDAIDEVRLRRVPFGPKHGLRKSYRFGPFSSTPIRLRLIRADVTLVQLTAVYWEGWAGLVRYLLAVPAIDSDSRTRGRLERYG